MQSDFECLQGRGTHHFSERPVPVLHSQVGVPECIYKLRDSIATRMQEDWIHASTIFTLGVPYRTLLGQQGKEIFDVLKSSRAKKNAPFKILV